MQMRDDDSAMVERVRALKPEAARRLSAMPGYFLEVSDALVIEAAWGPRRLTGRTRGMALRAYPASVGAARDLWEKWLGEDRPVSVVIAKKLAQARIDAAMGRSGIDPEMAEAEPLAEIRQDEIDDMMAERADLRSAKKFEEADRIRDYLILHGVQVNDDRAASRVA